MDLFLHSDLFMIIIMIINFMLVLLYILSNIKLTKLRKNYSDFMTKLGKGNDIYDMLKNYVEEVESLNLENKELKKYCNNLNKKADNCIHKVGLIRYNAYKDTGSNLSFALALLNEDNTGVILNGIYSRDTSNIYCKTITNGTSEYALSKEEEDALKEAVKDVKKEESNQ